MNKLIVLATIVVLLVAGAGVYGYIKFVPSEDERYNTQMTIVLRYENNKKRLKNQ